MAKSRSKQKSTAKRSTRPVVKSAAKNKTVVGFSGKGPIRIILEIVLKEVRGAGGGANLSLLGGEIVRTISYQFANNQITVLNLSIENKSVPNPGNSGNIELDFIPPSGQIAVSSMATAGPLGSGSLQLTYKGKNVFTPPADFKFTQGTGFINQTPQLP